MDNLFFEKDYKERGFAGQRRYPNEAFVQFLAGNFFHLTEKERKDTKILEIGCGSGANLWVVAREGFDTYGIDIAPSCMELCRSMIANYAFLSTPHLSVGNMRKLDFPDGHFDAIVDILSSEHTDFAGHKEVYSEVYRCLKSGGKFFSWHLGKNSVNRKEGGGVFLDEFTIDNAPNPNVPYANNGLTCFLTPEMAGYLLTEAGFADVKVERVLKSYKERTQDIEFLAITATKMK